MLQGDLEKLPFPILTEKESGRIISIVDRALNGEDIQSCLDQEILKIFDLSRRQIEIISQNGKNGHNEDCNTAYKRMP